MRLVLDCLSLWEKITARSNVSNSPSFSSPHLSSSSHSDTFQTSLHSTPPVSPTSSTSAPIRLRVCHFNANSIRAHIERVRLFLTSQPTFHIIGVTETKLSSVADDALVSLGDYALFRRDRNTAGGGVALYIHKSLSATCICTSTSVWSGKPGYPEYLFCEVTPRGGSPIFVGVVYRPPPMLLLSEVPIL